MKKMSQKALNKLKKEIYKDALVYYQSHPDEFCEDVLGIKLNLYQCIMMRAAFRYDFTIFIMCRGLGKSWLSMLILVVFCLLNPNTLAGIIAPSFRQAKQVVQEKYKDSLCNLSPFLQQEEEDYKCSVQVAEIKFFNESKITGFPLGTDGAKIRGARLHIVLVDEAAYVPKFIYEKVIKPMLVVKRDYKVGQKEGEGANNKIILASTADRRSNWLYKVYVDWAKAMLEGDNKHFTMTLPYQVGLKCGLLERSNIEDAKKTMIESEFAMEYLGLFPRISEKAWVNYDDLMNCSDLLHIETKGVDEFEYVMAVDVARIDGQDNTIMMIFKLHWFSDHVEADLIYIVPLNGASFSEQATQLRNLLRKFPKVIRIFMDTMTIGQGLTDELAKHYYNELEDEWYPPLIDMNDPVAMKNREVTGGVPIIYGFRATPEINHRCGYAIKNFTEKRWLHLYAQNAGDDEHMKTGKDFTVEEEKLLEETKATQEEVMLMETNGVYSGFVKFICKGKRKDRWSALGYGLYGIQLIKKERDDRNKRGEVLIAFHKR